MLNNCAHLFGPPRSIGAALIGYLGRLRIAVVFKKIEGLRCFVPNPVTRVIESVGGIPCLLGLVAMACDSGGQIFFYDRTA